MSWKFISFKDLFLFYVYKIFAYMSVYTCTWCLWRPEGVGFGVGVVINHHVGAGNRELPESYSSRSLF